MRRGLFGLIVTLWSCAESPPAMSESPPATPSAPAAATPAPPAPVPTPTPTPTASPTPAPATPPPDRAAPPPPAAALPELGAPQQELASEADRPLRSAIRERVQARPTVVTARHFLGADGATTSFVFYTFSHVERCMTEGRSREECRMGGGFGDTAFHSLRCLGAGLARVATRPGRAVAELQANAALHAEDLCSSSVRELVVDDVDRDGRPEVSLEYEWANLEQREAGDSTSWDLVERLVFRADLTLQVVLRLRAIFHPENSAFDDRNRVARLEVASPDAGGAPDLVLAATSWNADVCSSREPPPPSQPDCDLRERTERYVYDRAADEWRARGPVDPRSPTEPGPPLPAE